MTSSDRNYSEEDLLAIFDPDKVTETWFLTRSPYPTCLVLVAYLTFLRLGPRYMASRRPFQLTNTMRVYNLIQMVLNGFILLSAIIDKSVFAAVADTLCSLDNHESYTAVKYKLLLYSWLYLVLKILDLIDTVFMVLRKKDSHITFLHVYHHTAMTFFSWYTLAYIKSHHSTLPGVINSSVHAIMYTYYFMATFPQLKPYLWWKQYLTKLQLGQFAVVLVYLSSLYYYGCPISRRFTYIWIINVSVIFTFFVNFYVKSYCSPPVMDNSLRNKRKSA